MLNMQMLRNYYFSNEEIEKSLNPNSKFHPSSSLRIKSKNKMNEIFNHNEEEEKNCNNKNNEYDE